MSGGGGGGGGGGGSGGSGGSSGSGGGGTGSVTTCRVLVISVLRPTPSVTFKRSVMVLPGDLVTW
ncbi:hypothetical protein D7024_01145 [Desulfofundulus salinus]|uniref:Uncharacterized protein n=1 Tax=Desulfofundulus salinus TaxID=2419843 RepID=A0A494WR88_9FIRM|nr:hypothetical protein D7024_01145 [Desulfofundulus salinum]